jgi:hypothetical protein
MRFRLRALLRMLVFGPADRGKELWRTPRDEHTTWATPIIVEAHGKAQVVASATNFIRAYDLETGASRNVSKDAPTRFTNQENDYPVAQKPSYGIAGWTKDDHSVIVYDAYDLWDLGEFNQKGSVETRWGTKDELLRASRVAQR